MKLASHLLEVMIIFLTSVAFSFAWQASGSPDTVEIYGRVTDFKSSPIQGAMVMLKDDRFEDVATAISDEDGRYSLAAPKGHYMALAAVKDYQIKNLEYWAWSVPATQNLEINPRFDRIEVYAINAWRPQGAYPSYQIYFRPMSLSRVVKKVVAAGGMEKFNKLPVMDIAPELSKSDIQVSIDGQKVAVLEVNRIREAAGQNQTMFGYLIQVELPEKETEWEYSVINVTLKDSATDEMGEGCCFVSKTFMKSAALQKSKP
jgi:hypothetical protein